MAKEWVEGLAKEIREKHRAAAEEHGRAQHYAEIVSKQGKEFFLALAASLRQDVDALRSQLQGDVTGTETLVNSPRPDEVLITRAGFPWVDARLTHREDTITLDYVKGRGAQGDAALDRQSRSFAFHVAGNDAVYVKDAFGEPARRYEGPEDLAREIVEFLFRV